MLPFIVWGLVLLIIINQSLSIYLAYRLWVTQVTLGMAFESMMKLLIYYQPESDLLEEGDSAGLLG